MSPTKPQGSNPEPQPDEATPLLSDLNNAPREQTPLPVTQIIVLLLLQLCEPITSLSINPYIYQVRSFTPIK
jgi:hypothetical protein